MKEGSERMKVVVAIDSLKGSLPSMEAGYAVAEGVKRADSSAEVIVRPLADGGEGTVDTLVYGMGGTNREIVVTGPLGESVNCTYGIIEDKKLAVIEMSGAAGLTLIPEAERNPLYTTTYGVGEIIKDAISMGCRHFVVGIGGSATNDGGAGMLQALGFELLDAEGQQIPQGAVGLSKLHDINCTYAIPELKGCHFRIACDVENVLYGEYGSSAVFGPQKGATEEMIVQMDGWLKKYAELVKEKRPEADPLLPGTGAAGGLGFAFHAFTDAVLESGIKIVLDETELEEYIKDASLVITGEGKLDGQTTMGKAPMGVAHLAKKYDIPVVALAGSVTSDASACNQYGIDAYFSILQSTCTLEEAMKAEQTWENLIQTSEQVLRLWNAKGRKAR